MEIPPLPPGSIHGTPDVKVETHTSSDEKVLHPNPFQAERGGSSGGKGP